MPGAPTIGRDEADEMMPTSGAGTGDAGVRAWPLTTKPAT